MSSKEVVYERVKSLLDRNFAWDDNYGMYRINFADAYDSEGYWLVGIVDPVDVDEYHRADYPGANILINVYGITSVDSHPEIFRSFIKNRNELLDIEEIYRHTMEQDNFGIFKEMADKYFWNEESQAWDLSLNYYFDPEGHSDADILAKIGECVTEGTNRIIEGRDNIIGSVATLADKDFREHLEEIGQDSNNISSSIL